jgi:hypothetical protein
MANEVPIGFAVPKDLAEALERAAAKELISKAAFARRAVAAAVRAAGVSLPTDEVAA